MSEFIMGFDFGTTKIGVAIGQHVTKTATALAIVRARDGKPRWEQLDALVNEWQPTTMVVGLPLNMDGSTSNMAVAAKKFAGRLTGRYGTPTQLMDERLTTFEAKQQSDSELVDAIAAKLILESWLRNYSASLSDKP